MKKLSEFVEAVGKTLSAGAMTPATAEVIGQAIGLGAQAAPSSDEILARRLDEALARERTLRTRLARVEGELDDLRETAGERWDQLVVEQRERDEAVGELKKVRGELEALRDAHEALREAFADAGTQYEKVRRAKLDGDARLYDEKQRTARLTRAAKRAGCMYLNATRAHGKTLIELDEARALLAAADKLATAATAAYERAQDRAGEENRKRWWAISDFRTAVTKELQRLIAADSVWGAATGLREALRVVQAVAAPAVEEAT